VPVCLFTLLSLSLSFSLLSLLPACEKKKKKEEEKRMKRRKRKNEEEEKDEQEREEGNVNSVERRSPWDTRSE